MDIVGLERMDREQLSSELARGGRFVIHQYCFSVLVMTLKRPSPIFFIRQRRGRTRPQVLADLAAGRLVGIPWGPIWTVQSVVRNLGGGRDVTAQIAASMQIPFSTAAPALPGT